MTAKPDQQHKPNKREVKTMKTRNHSCRGWKKIQLERLLLSLLHRTNVPSQRAHVRACACAHLGSRNRFSTDKSCTERKHLEIFHSNCCSCPLNNISLLILIDNNNYYYLKWRMGCILEGVKRRGRLRKTVKTFLGLKGKSPSEQGGGWKPQNRDASHQISSKVEKLPTAA